jgi:uncharacterized DUF497 family protein
MRKHGIRFETAEFVFLDPLALSLVDRYPDEERCQTIGMVGFTILFVVHTWPDALQEGGEIGRIISARKADARERKAYADGYETFGPTDQGT